MVFILSYVLLLYLGSQQNLFIRDGDVYFHIATGRWILSHHSIPTTDPFFSETVAGHPWLVYYWLSDVLLALAQKWLGWIGILILPALAISTSLAVLASYLRKRLGFWFALIAILLSFDILLWRVMPRPHILELPFATLWFIGFIRARAEHSAPSYWNLIPLLFWVNLHAVESSIAIVIAGAFLLEASIYLPRIDNRVVVLRQWKIFFLLACIVSMMTPYTYKTWAITSYLVNSNTHAYVTEWFPTGCHLWPLNCWIFLVIAAGFGLGLQVPWFRLMMFLGLTLLTFAHWYVLTLFSIFAPLLLADPFHRVLPWREALEQKQVKTKSAGMILIPFIIIFVMITVFAAQRIQFEQNNVFTPANAVDFAEKNGLVGKRLLNIFEQGGYLIYRGVPAFIDPRIELYDLHFYENNQNKVALLRDGLTGLEHYLNQNKIEWVMLPPSMLATVALLHSRQWKYVYADSNAVIFVRKNL